MVSAAEAFAAATANLVCHYRAYSSIDAGTIHHYLEQARWFQKKATTLIAEAESRLIPDTVCGAEIYDQPENYDDILYPRP